MFGDGSESVRTLTEQAAGLREPPRERGGSRAMRFWILPFVLSLWLCQPAQALSLERLNDQEIASVKATLEALDPLITDRKRQGSAPVLTFEELYRPLSRSQADFVQAIRNLDPVALGGSNRKLTAPSPSERFVRLESQVVRREGTPILLDAQYLPSGVYESYCAMMKGMEEDLGKRLLVESGYRSPAYQLYLFIFYLSNHNYSIRETNRFVALPGFSEHGSPASQAIDFITPEGINGEDRPEEFEELQEYGWLRARAHEFGFHLSYPRQTKRGLTPLKGSDPIGSSAFEPWHWHWEGTP